MKHNAFITLVLNIEKKYLKKKIERWETNI